jgi:hypothetical protein
MSFATGDSDSRLPAYVNASNTITDAHHRAVVEVGADEPRAARDQHRMGQTLAGRSGAQTMLVRHFMRRRLPCRFAGEPRPQPACAVGSAASGWSRWTPGSGSPRLRSAAARRSAVVRRRSRSDHHRHLILGVDDRLAAAKRDPHVRRDCRTPAAPSFPPIARPVPAPTSSARRPP